MKRIQTNIRIIRIIQHVSAMFWHAERTEIKETIFCVYLRFLCAKNSFSFIFHSSLKLVSLQHDYSQPIHTDKEILRHQPVWRDFRATWGAPPCQGNQPWTHSYGADVWNVVRVFLSVVCDGVVGAACQVQGQVCGLQEYPFREGGLSSWRRAPLSTTPKALCLASWIKQGERNQCDSFPLIVYSNEGEMVYFKLSTHFLTSSWLNLLRLIGSFQLPFGAEGCK